MKRIFVWAFSIVLIIPSCLKFVEPSNRSIHVVLAANSFTSDVGEVYIQRFVPTTLEVLIPDSLSITGVSWKIENTHSYLKRAVHKFNILGEVFLSVEVTFSNGIKASRNFTVRVVDNLSKVDPVIITPLSRVNGKTELLFLFSRERLRYAKDTVLYYIGNLTDWKNVRAVYRSYIVDGAGKAIIATDAGKYVGFKLSLADNQYEIALVHSNNIWTNFSGSKYISPENLGRIKFSLRSMEVTP